MGVVLLYRRGDDGRHSKRVTELTSSNQIVRKEQMTDPKPCLPLKWLTESEYLTGDSYTGVLCTNGGRYIGQGSGGMVAAKWLYAETTVSPFFMQIPDGTTWLWTLQRKSDESLVLQLLGSPAWYLSWNDISRSCKLYDERVRITTNHWDGTEFRIHDPADGEYVGVLTNPKIYLNDKYLLNLKADTATFKFQYFDFAAFSEEDKALYDQWANWNQGLIDRDLE